MDITLGFLVAFFLVILPGLIFRRLYYFGEFSKQFSANHSLISLIAIVCIPGIVNLILIFFLFDYFIEEIDVGKVIDKFKEINDPGHKFENDGGTPLRQILLKDASPFLVFLYSVSLLFGLAFGRIVRKTKIDTYSKILRYKNYWFYLFNGQHPGFRKMESINKKGFKHLFTKADIMIDTESQPHLYSGIIIDYELAPNKNQILDKIFLKEAKRYKITDGGERKIKPIPGNILVVDCKSMKNMNLTYVYEETTKFLESKWPSRIESIITLLIFAVIPIFIVKTEYIEWDIYTKYFELKWYAKAVAILLAIQVLNILNPIVSNKGGYKWVNGWSFLAKVVWILAFFILLIILS